MTRPVSMVSERGALRGAVLSLHNVYSLLRSPKVAPRLIAPLVPEAHATASEAASLARAIVDDLCTQMPAWRPAGDALLATIDQASSPIVAAFAAVSGPELAVRARLSLEAALARSAPSLDAACQLIELCAQAVDEPTTELDLHEVLDAVAPAQEPRQPLLWWRRASLAVALPPRGQTTFVAPARVVTGLLSLCVSHALGGAPPRPSKPAQPRGPDVVVSSRASVSSPLTTVLVEPASTARLPRSAEIRQVALPISVPALYLAAPHLAQVASCSLSLSAEKPAVQLTFGG